MIINIIIIIILIVDWYWADTFYSFEMKIAILLSQCLHFFF